MKHKISFSTFFCLILGLSSCTAFKTDIRVRPRGYNLDYWIAEKIDVANMDSSLFYESKYEGVNIYLDSKYEFIEEQGKTKLPEKYVIYDFNIEKSMIKVITITDPAISIYGLSMNSNETSIKRTLSNMGFSYQEYSGMYPSYVKDNFYFIINKHVMMLSII